MPDFELPGKKQKSVFKQLHYRCSKAAVGTYFFTKGWLTADWEAGLNK